MKSNFTLKLEIYVKNHPITSIILMMNFVFALMLLATGGFEIGNLVRWGALFPPFVFEEGEYYRILTSMFLHGSILHFLSNSFVLYFIGAYLERLVGPKRYLIVYMVSGIVSGLFVLFFGSQSAVTIGASGAIFGVIGGLLMLTILKRSWFTYQTVKSIRNLIILNVIITVVIPNISIAGHLGGFVAGILLFFVITPKMPYYYVQKMSRRDDDDDQTIYPA